MGRALLDIDDSLRFFLFGLETALGVGFEVFEVERVFEDARTNGCREIRYDLHSTRRARVSGWVEAYEPDTIWIEVSTPLWTDDKLAALAEESRLQVRRLNDHRERGQG